MRALFFALAALSFFAVLTARPISFYENGEEYHHGHIPEQNKTGGRFVGCPNGWFVLVWFAKCSRKNWYWLIIKQCQCFMFTWMSFELLYTILDIIPEEWLQNKFEYLLSFFNLSPGCRFGCCHEWAWVGQCNKRQGIVSEQGGWRGNMVFSVRKQVEGVRTEDAEDYNRIWWTKRLLRTKDG